MRKLIRSLFVLPLLWTDASHAGDNAPLRLVHFDRVDPARVERFEEVRRTWLAVIHKKKLDTLSQPLLQWGPSTFVAFSKVSNFAALDDKLSAPTPPADDAETKAARAAYHADTHKVLLAPHHSEVWKIDDELSFSPRASSISEENFGAAQLISLHVPIAKWERFKKTVKEVNQALTSARYPLPILTFETVYGSGRYYFLVLARDEVQLKQTATIEETLQKALGKTQAKFLMQKRDADSQDIEKFTVSVRRDLVRIP